MHRVATLWKANAIAFVSSFCVMVIELIAARIMAPHIGVSLYTWTSIIGVILAGIALGNFLGGKLADKYPSPFILAGIFFAGSFLTVGILPAVKVIASADWFSSLPVMWNFTLKTTGIFFLPAIILSMVSPMLIKLALSDVGRTGSVVGTIYACSTAGSILGTFMTGFYFVLWFGTRTTVWLVGLVLLLTGVISWLVWKVPNRWKFSLKNLVIWTTVIEILLVYGGLYRFRTLWEEKYTRESNYYAINVVDMGGGIKALNLDFLTHGFAAPENPTTLIYDYLNVFAQITRYKVQNNPAPRILHLGGGAYTFPQWLEVIYPDGVNEVVEIDPAVTQVVHQELGLPLDTPVKTYNEDARLFLIQRKSAEKYDVALGDVFNDKATPFHLTTLEFDKLVRANLTDDGVYLVNIIDDYRSGRYMPSFIFTLKHAFRYVYLFSTGGTWETAGLATYVIAASDQQIDLSDYQRFVVDGRMGKPLGEPLDPAKLEEYLAARKPLLLTDDYVPTDIMVASIER